MSEPGSPIATPHVVVYALIGRDERLLLVEHPDHTTLPGGPVRTGEPVEQALRRALRDQLRATAAAVDFCAVVERDTTQPGHPATSELVFLFDVTLTERDRLDESAPRPHRWAGERELSTLEPTAVRDALIAGTLWAENPWQAWTP
ncbi:NUDIX domain-containing protein [Prauserella flavalba]|uniref:ADP-ribose pyrophosphatase n=1 Tax=Prauserella flavalba TaxID=1477506 RepID=A0A318LRB1_9PSEU|nr:NUDIX domain-containing protein [Prauserella flavalba]PXY37244.1 ADP-ribose pyrophosphatase [Prauserella flavalba]